MKIGEARLASELPPFYALAISLCVLAGCQTSAPGPGSMQASTAERALPVMERIAVSASRCWFKSGDSEFRAYKMAPELSSHIGRPRVLLVPSSRPQDRPLAVIEAEGDPAVVRAYGPLLSAPTGNRIAADVRNWAAGGTGCSR